MSTQKFTSNLTLRQHILRLPLFYKILVANSAIVALGAVAGTIITIWHVQTFPEDVHYGLIAFFGLSGLLISFFVNKWVLNLALEPLGHIQEAVHQVRGGATQVQVQALRELTAQALEEVRRVALDLRPTILDDLGLGPALEWRVDEFTAANGIRAAVEIEGLNRRLPRDLELAFYRIGQEALSNVARHAQAEQVTVSLRSSDCCLSLEVTDDGLGFDPAGVKPTHTPRGLGLLGMRERMAMVNGRLVIESQPGRGTRVVAEAPVD